MTASEFSGVRENQNLYSPIFLLTKSSSGQMALSEILGSLQERGGPLEVHFCLLGFSGFLLTQNCSLFIGTPVNSALGFLN